MMMDIKTENRKSESFQFTFFDHADELRVRFIKCAISACISTVIIYFFIDIVIEILSKPVGQLVFTSPADAFLARISLAIYLGCFLSLPIFIYQVWSFVGIALERKEKKYVSVYAPVSFLLFILGAVFSYYIMIPISIKFLLGFSTQVVVPMITIKSYISYIGTLILAFGVIFELPLVLLFLTKIGIATPVFLQQKRKYAVVIILVVSALITPPDFITQLIMAGPLLFLYEVGIIVSQISCRNK